MPASKEVKVADAKKAPARKSPAQNTPTKAVSTKAEAVKKPAVKKVKVIASYPDGWNIEEEKDGLVLVFYKMENPIMKIDITPETMGEMLQELNNVLIVDSNLADSWTVRTPEDKNLTDFLTLLNSGKILGTLEIDKATGFKMWMYLSKYKPQVNPRKAIIQWARKHRILSGMFLAVAIPMTLFLLYRIVVNSIPGLS